MISDSTPDKRVKLAFGGFDCEIVGYDEPLSVLDKILALYVATAEARPEMAECSADDAARLRARFAEILASRADTMGVSVARGEDGVAVSPPRPEPAKPEAAPTPPHLSTMDPGLLAEFAAMRARLKDREEPAPAEAKAKAEEPGAAPQRPRVRIIRAGEAKPEGAPAEAARAVEAPAAAAPAAATETAAVAADGEMDNFLFAETPEPRSAAAKAEAAQAGAAPAAEKAAGADAGSDVSRFGFLRRMMPQAGATPAPGAEDGPFRRLREASEAALPRIDETPARAAEPRLALVRPARAPLSGPAAFAAEAGATGLAEHVEAAAAWLALSEKRARFSRRDVMQALAGIEAAAGYSLEARMKAFRTLLKSGVLVREEDGLYALSRSTRFGSEGRLRA